MTIKPTDTQLVLMSAAAQREDRCLVAPPTLKGGVAQKVANRLIGAGLVKEIKAKSGVPIWRRDKESGQACALKLTAAGAEAIAVDDSAAREHVGKQGGALGNRDQTAFQPKLERRGARSAVRNAAAPRGRTAPRGGSKLMQVIALLERDHGASIDELIAATGWLAHTTRAALTGLRKRGYAVAIDRSDKQRGSFYRIPADQTGEDKAPAARLAEDPARSPTVRKRAQRRSKLQARQAA
jgi:hypothetical protein